MTDGATGAVTIWTQKAVGTSEPERTTYHSIHERLRVLSSSDYAPGRVRRAADGQRDHRHLAGRRARRPPGFRGPEPLRAVPQRLPDGDGSDRWYPGPVTHPYPGVSNCRTDPALVGDPAGYPWSGLPDCVPLSDSLNQLSDLAGLPEPPAVPKSPVDPGLDTDDFQRLGIPVPANYAAPWLHRASRRTSTCTSRRSGSGDILFTVCSCEQWADQSRKHRDAGPTAVIGNEHLGYDWKAHSCTQNGDGT